MYQILLLLSIHIFHIMTLFLNSYGSWFLLGSGRRYPQSFSHGENSYISWFCNTFLHLQSPVAIGDNVFIIWLCIFTFAYLVSDNSFSFKKRVQAWVFFA